MCVLKRKKNIYIVVASVVMLLSIVYVLCVYADMFVLFFPMEYTECDLAFARISHSFLLYCFSIWWNFHGYDYLQKYTLPRYYSLQPLATVIFKLFCQTCVCTYVHNTCVVNGLYV